MADTDSLNGQPIGKQVDLFPAEWPEKKELRGRYVTLRALNPAVHGDDLWNAVGGADRADLWSYMSEGPFADRWEFENSLRNAAAQEDPVFLAVIDNETGKVVGRTAYLRIFPNHRIIEIGHLMFSGELQQTRGATEAIFLMLAYAFDELKYRRCEWKCNALNAKSRRAALRLGFTFEGIFRQHFIIKGRNRDTAWYSMLDSEWPAIQSAFQNWLEPGNFDGAGRQKRALGEFMAEKG